MRAQAALEQLIDDAARAATIVGIIAHAWADLQPQDRLQIGREWPPLARALQMAEEYDGDET